MAFTEGYKQPSGTFFDATEPMRFLRLQNFASAASSTSSLLLYSGSAPPLSNSAFRFVYYHYDEWLTKSSGWKQNGINITSGLLDWMRSGEPLTWYYYDQGPSGNFIRKLLKNVSYPYDDITTVPSGGYPINFSGIPALDSSLRSLSVGTAEKFPWYQSAGLIEQCQTAFSGMFANPIANSVHPYFNGGISPLLSNIPVPQIPQNIALQLNNLTLKPTTWLDDKYSGNGIPSGFPYGGGSGQSYIVIRSSGQTPILDMAQQINYPKEYISNISAIVKSSPAGGTPNSGCKIPWNNGGQGNAAFYPADNDLWYSALYFGFMAPSSLSISLSGSVPSYIFPGVEYDFLGNQRNISFVASPTLTSTLYNYDDNWNQTSLWSLSASITGNNFNYNINSSGYYLNVTTSFGSEYNLTNSLQASGYLPNTSINTFQRYYDQNTIVSVPAFPTSAGTRNFLLTNKISWYLSKFNQPVCSTVDPAGGTCYSTVIKGYPSGFSIDPNSLNLKINDVNIPTSTISSGKSTDVGFTVFYPSIPDPKYGCYTIISGWATVKYTLPSYVACGFTAISQCTRGPDNVGVITKPACDANFNYTNCAAGNGCDVNQGCYLFYESFCVSQCCTALPCGLQGPCALFSSYCVNRQIQPVLANNLKCGCTNFFPYNAGVGCVSCGPNGVGAPACANYTSPTYYTFVGNGINFTVQNPCGFQVLQGSLPCIPNYNNCNAWDTTQQQQKIFIPGVFAGGLCNLLDIWQNLTLTLNAQTDIVPTLIPDNIQCTYPILTACQQAKNWGCGQYDWQGNPAPGKVGPGNLLISSLPLTTINPIGYCYGPGCNASSGFKVNTWTDKVMTDANKTVSIDEIDVEVLVRKPDGSQETVSFTIGGVSTALSPIISVGPGVPACDGVVCSGLYSAPVSITGGGGGIQPGDVGLNPP